MSLPSSMADFVPCDRLLQKAYWFIADFLFLLCEMDGEVYFSDHLKHCISKINFSEQSVALILGHINEPNIKLMDIAAPLNCVSPLV